MAVREWEQSVNSRGYVETSCGGQHVPLSEMKMDPDLDMRYLGKSIPSYPSVVFHSSEVFHVTGKNGLQCIFSDGGFKTSNNQDANFLWFTLHVTEDNITTAEQRFLHYILPHYKTQSQQHFLEHFTTSPAFQSESRYGNFRFTFTLKELLHQYACQFCYNSAPVFRVLDTKVYQQEIMYSVLVHPWYITRYNHLPRLPRRHNEGICGYLNGRMSWHCQAPSKTHRFRMEVDNQRSRVYNIDLRNEEYYMWDKVAVAFHMKPHWTLRMNRKRLYNSVSVCEATEPNLMRKPDTPLSKDEAEETLKDLAWQ